MARFLIDESLPRAVATALAAAGHDARDCGLRGAPDGTVHARAVSEDRVLVSGDTDFANTLRFRPGTHPGIVVLGVPNEWSPIGARLAALLRKRYVNRSCRPNA